MPSKVPNLSGQSVANVQRVVNQVIAQVNKALAASGSGSGTVTSVGLSSSSLTIGGTNPVTSSGTITVELPSVIAPDTYNLLTIDAEGRATAGMLVAYLTGNQTITLSGDASGSGATAIAVTLATVNADVGQFSALTVNGKGLVTAATNLALTGDVTGTASGAGLATTLKNTGTAGTYTSVTTDAQGRVTAGSNPGFGSGTVTSVTFTGDGTVLSSTPSSAVTTTGTLTATLHTQSANVVLAGPTSGPAANPTFRALTLASADFANQGTTATVLHGNAAGNPSFAAVDLAADVTGTLPVANGGTSLATLTAHALYAGAGTSAPTALSVGATNTVLHGNTGADPSFSAVSLTADVSGVLTLAHGGTGSANGPAMPINTQSGTSYSLQASDDASLVRFTNAAATTVTWPNPGTVAANWWCVVENALTGTTGANQTLTHNTTAGTIDGFASGAGCTYVGSQILGISDGSNIQVILLRGGFIQLLNADSAFTYKTAIGAKRFFVEIWAGAGSGGSGNSGTAGGARAGGGGGGGGACVFGWFKASDLGSSITCTIAAAQSTVGTSSTAAIGKVGTVGNNTTFGTLLTAYGGGAGAPGLAATNSGGAGGGWGSAGGAGGAANSTVGGDTGTATAGQFTGGGGQIGVAGRPSTYGGAAGGGGGVAGTPTGLAGGSATKGGPGGGSGAGLTAGNVADVGGAGGSGQGTTSGGGGAGGSAGTSNVAGGTPSNPSGAATTLGPGLGGGGGGSGFGTATVSAGGTGANGGIAAGGGGGGASDSTKASGAGGQGGPGLTRIWDHP